MSNFDKGKSFEQAVARMVRRKADMLAKRNPGSHTNGARRADVFTNLPIHIECKDQETVKIKEWFEQADAAASSHQVPVVVFHKDEEVLATLRFNDLLDLFMQIADQQAEIDDLRQPLPATPSGMVTGQQLQPAAKTVPPLIPQINERAKQQAERGAKTCRNGHLADDYGYCMQVACPYSRGYKKPKGSKGGKKK